LIDRCDSCGRLGELFQLPDRRDSNCAECNADISTLVSLYRRLEVVHPGDEHSADLEDRLVTVLHRFLGRSKLGNSDQFVHGLTLLGNENYVN
jgi:hypothetical protein